MSAPLPVRAEDDAFAPPLRILIVRTGAMGDILHGMPAVAALRHALPRSYVGWAVEPHWIPLLKSDSAQSASEMPLVDRVHAVPTREWKARPLSVATLRQIANLRRELRSERYDVCIDLQGSIRSAVLGRLSGSVRLLGPRRPRERQARAFYGERVDLTSRHVVAQACELVAAGAGLAHLEPAAALLPQDHAAEAWCEATRRGWVTPGRFILLVPGAGWGAKRWPIEHFAELTYALKEQGIAVLVNASFESTIDPALRAAGAIAVPCSIAQLTALTRRASLVIGGDTGPVHLAAALGRPVVALFGPTDPLRNGPEFPGARVKVLRHPVSVVDHRRHAETEPGLAQITVGDVVAAARQMLTRHEPEERRVRVQTATNTINMVNRIPHKTFGANGHG